MLYYFVYKCNYHSGQLNILSLFPAFLYDHNFRQQWHRSQWMPQAETPEFWLTLRLWCRKQWDIDALYPLSLYSESRERGAKRTLYTEIKVLCKPAARSRPIPDFSAD